MSKEPLRSYSTGRFLSELTISQITVTRFVASADLIPILSNGFVNPDTIFANNEMSLEDIEIYGFDYDYTLAFYSRHLHTLIFSIARDILIQQHRVGSSSAPAK